MKKAVILASVGALCMFILAGYFLVNGKSPVQTGATKEEEVASSSVATENEVLRGTGSLTALLGLGRPLECTITYDTPSASGEITGTYFTAGGVLRGDFVIPEMATGSVSSLIIRDNTLYTWSTIDGETYGMKVDLATLEAAKGSDTAPDTNEPVPLDAPVSYECRSWPSVDGSVFAVPTDVLFTDYATIMNKGMEFGTIYEESAATAATQCSLCEQVEGEGREACKAQFKCE